MPPSKQWPAELVRNLKDLNNTEIICWHRVETQTGGEDHVVIKNQADYCKLVVAKSNNTWQGQFKRYGFETIPEKDPRRLDRWEGSQYYHRLFHPLLSEADALEQMVRTKETKDIAQRVAEKKRKRKIQASQLLIRHYVLPLTHS